VSNKKKKGYKIGDGLVEDGRVYRIFKICLEKNEEGTKNKTIYFKPHFKEERPDLICSVPLSKIEMAGIRRPVSKNKLKKVFEVLSRKIKRNEQIDILVLKENLNKNKPRVTAKILKVLWLDKNRENATFSPTKKSIYTKAFKSLIEEIAYVEHISLEKAKMNIQKALTASAPKPDG
jgi:RNA polymerase-interacting CarD/CdnL/TRCF family regulator